MPGDYKPTQTIIEEARRENRKSGVSLKDRTTGKDITEDYLNDLIKYETTYEQKRMDRFLSRVKNPQTNEYWQMQVLKLSGVITNTESAFDHKTYPLQFTDQILRVKLPNNSEWLKSRSTLIGLDRLGNEVGLSITDPEIYERPILTYEYVHSDPTDTTSKLVRVGRTTARNETVYTLPFNGENFDKLYAMGRDWSQENAGISLGIIKAGYSTPSYNITDVGRFRNENFDELYTWCATPKFSLDRSIQNQLEKKDQNQNQNFIK